MKNFLATATLVAALSFTGVAEGFPKNPKLLCPPITSKRWIEYRVWQETQKIGFQKESQFGTASLDITGFYTLCREHPKALVCAGGRGGNLTLAQVIAVDSRVRASFQYREDALLYGAHLDDKWTVDATCGDCFAEDEQFWCYVGDALILRRIDQMLVGTEVLSYDLLKGEFCRQVVTNHTYKGVKPVKQVNFKNWGSIRVTEDHNMWSRDSQKHFGFSKRKLSDFKARQHTQIPFINRLPYNSVDIPELTEDHCYLIGHYLAEGWYSWRHICTSGYEIPEEVIPRLDKLNIPYTLGENNSGVPVINYRKSDFKEVLRPLKTNSFNIDISRFQNLPLPKLQALIDGYFCGDGHYHLNDRILSTSDRRFAVQMMDVQLKLGKPTYLYTQEDHGGSGDQPIYRVFYNPGSSRHVERGYPEIGQLRAKISDEGDSVGVWDVTISETSTFIHQNGMLAHNCEDFALRLSEEIHKAGQAGDQMGLVLWIPQPGVGHATLVVKTKDAGEVEIGVSANEKPHSMNWRLGWRITTIWMDGKREFSKTPFGGPVTITH